MLSFVIFTWELLGVSFKALLLYAFVYTVVAEGRDRYIKWRNKRKK
ncbi:hypothetical protein [Blautia argi]|nr:hypothetical protein [Blautia argi]